MSNDHVTIGQFIATFMQQNSISIRERELKMRKSGVARDANFSFPDINRFMYKMYCVNDACR